MPRIRIIAGPYVPEATIRRRFAAGRSNFEGYYRQLVDAWLLYDDSGDEPRVLQWGRERMNGDTLWKAKDPDLVNSLAAMRRAALLARELAVRTGTAIVVSRDGRLTRATAEDLREAAVR